MNFERPYQLVTFRRTQAGDVRAFKVDAPLASLSAAFEAAHKLAVNSGKTVAITHLGEQFVDVCADGAHIYTYTPAA